MGLFFLFLAKSGEDDKPKKHVVDCCSYHVSSKCWVRDFFYGFIYTRKAHCLIKHERRETQHEQRCELARHVKTFRNWDVHPSNSAKKLPKAVHGFWTGRCTPCLKELAITQSRSSSKNPRIPPLKTSYLYNQCSVAYSHRSRLQITYLWWICWTYQELPKRPR